MNDISVVVVEDSQCGKTQIINQLANGYFSEVGEEEKPNMRSAQKSRPCTANCRWRVIIVFWGEWDECCP
jgi:hypothetical protein